MGAIASGIMATIGAAAILAVIAGAAGGAFLWKARGGLALGGPALAGTYFMVVLFVLEISWLGAVLFGIVPLALTFLTSYLAACHLTMRAELRPLWAALAALVIALIVGFLYLLSLRIDIWMSTWIAVVINACLVLVAIRNWKLALR